MKQIVFCCLLTVILLVQTACQINIPFSQATSSGTAPIKTGSTTSPHTPYDPDTQDGPVHIRYRTIGQGYLSGITDQTLNDEHPVASRVEAVADLGYRFSHWSDGSTDPLRFGDSFAKDTELIAYFEQVLLNLPAISLTTEIPADQITKTEYVAGTLSVTCCDKEDCDRKTHITQFATEIRGRGNGSWTFDKKGWKLKLSSGLSLLDLGKGKSREWVLIANHIDRSLLRNAAATWIQNQMDLIFVPEYAFVDLYLNGEYMGVYQLYEQIEIDEHKVSLPEGDTCALRYFAELTAYASEPYVNCDSKRYEILSDLPENDRDAYLKAISDHLLACYHAAESGDYDQINTLIDLPSVIDSYIVEELTKNLDSGWDSFYLYLPPGGKLTFGPVWDFDLSSGNAKADAESICYETFPSPEGLYPGNINANDHQHNPWFLMLMKQDWFVEMVKERWQEVSPRMELLPDMIERTGKTYQTAFERNFMRWKIFGKRLSKDSYEVLALDTYDKQLDYLVSWYRDRIAWLNQEWGN